MAACTAGALVIRCGGSRSPASRGTAGVPKVCMQIPQRHSIVETVQKKLQDIGKNRALRDAALGVFNFVMFNLPAALALAEEEKERPKLFDFNATLPFIAVEILFLTYWLDGNLFKPVMKHMEDREYIIKKMGDDAEAKQKEAEALEAELEATLVATKAEVMALYEQKEQKYQRMYEETTRRLKAERLRNLAAVKAKIDGEIDEELASPDYEKERKNLAKLILGKILPAGTPQDKIDEMVEKAPRPSREQIENCTYLPKPPPPF